MDRIHFNCAIKNVCMLVLKCIPVTISHNRHTYECSCDFNNKRIELRCAVIIVQMGLIAHGYRAHLLIFFRFVSFKSISGPTRKKSVKRMRENTVARLNYSASPSETNCTWTSHIICIPKIYTRISRTNLNTTPHPLAAEGAVCKIGSDHVWSDKVEQRMKWTTKNFDWVRHGKRMWTRRSYLRKNASYNPR